MKHHTVASMHAPLCQHCGVHMRWTCQSKGLAARVTVLWFCPTCKSKVPLATDVPFSWQANLRVVLPVSLS
jgi:hypothetical protein